MSIRKKKVINVRKVSAKKVSQFLHAAHLMRKKKDQDKIFRLL